MANPIFHSQYTAQQIEDSIGRTPTIKLSTRTWMIWDISTSSYVDTGISVDSTIIIDMTLSQPGAAADSGVVGQKLRWIPGTDLLAGGNRADTTNAGIDFTWNEAQTVCTVNGTVSGTSSARDYIAGGSATFPAGLEAGKTYHVKCKTSSTAVYLGFTYFKNGAYLSAKNIQADQDVTIPEAATGMYVSVAVFPGNSVTNEQLYDFGIIAEEAVGEDEVIPLRGVVNELVRDAAHAVTVDGVEFATIERGGLSLSSGAIVKTVNAKRLRLATALTDGMFKISCDKGYFYELAVSGKSVIYGKAGVCEECTVSFGAAGSFSVALGRDDNADISIAEGQHLHIIRVSDFGTPEELSFHGPVRLGGLNSPALAVNDNNLPSTAYDYSYTEVFRIPEGGFSVSVPFDPVAATRKYWHAAFYRMVNGRLTIADGYQYGYMLDTYAAHRTVGSSMTTYYPYEEGIYAQIGTNGPEVTSVSTYAEPDGGRLLTIAPMSIRQVSSGGVLQDCLPEFRMSASGSYTAAQMIYGSIIRIEDADSISCAPRYSLSAWFYDGTTGEDGTLIPVDSEFSTPVTGLAVGGPTHIDLRGRNAVFAVIGIRCAAWPSGTAAADKDTDTMGILAIEDDVLDCVHVAWKNHVTITHKNQILQIIGENIRWLKNFTFPEIKAHLYRGPWWPDNIAFSKARNATLGFYAGKTLANTPLSMVTMESYSAALKNPYSRTYSGDWSPYSGPDIQPTGYNLRGYGWICGNLMNVLCGYKWYSTEAGYYKIQNYNNFEVIKGFDLETDVDELRAGDWLWGQKVTTETPEESAAYLAHDYHVMLVTDVIYVNGVPFAVEFLEAYPPIVRRRFICLDPLLRQKTAEFSGEDAFSYFNLIARPDRKTMRRIADIWDTTVSDYTLGKIACDRGHNSIYTTEDEHIYITVFDSSVSTIDIVNTSTSQTVSITVSGYSNKVHFYNSDLWTLDIRDTIAGMGAGSYELRVDGVAEEAFLVPSVPTLGIAWPEESDQVQEVVVTTGSSTYTLINIVGWYYATRANNDAYPAANASESITYEQDAQTGSWHYIIANDGEYTPPSDATLYRRLKFRISIRPEDMVDGKAHLPYATKFPIDCPGEDPHDYTLRFVTVQYETPNGGFVVGGDRVISQEQTVERRWANTDNITPYD